MRRFWSTVVWPILETMQPRVVLEIGAGSGVHTRRLAKFCQASSATLHVIDPAPRFDPLDGVILHTARSLDVLGDLGPVDVALIDGDHNWYTLFHELRELRRTAREGGGQTPVVICHDACWPYGRRDLPYDGFEYGTRGTRGPGCGPRAVTAPLPARRDAAACWRRGRTSVRDRRSIRG